MAEALRMRITLFALWCLLIIIPLGIAHGFSISSLFQFGDSLSDTGNRGIAFPNAPTSKLVRQPPYGMTFFHHPANRVSDGRLIIDFIATRLGFKFLSPYLSNQDFTNGVNFAVAGATAISLETYKRENVSLQNTFALNTQLGWFLELKRRSPENFSASHFENALYIVGEIGGNDYGRMWQQGWKPAKVASFVHLVIASIENHTRSLYAAGARRFLVVNLPLQGCNPRNFAMSLPDDEYDKRLGCILRMKRIGERHNSELRATVEKLEKELNNSIFILADFYKVMVKVVGNPSAYGIMNKREACCGTYTRSLSVDCAETKRINGTLFKGMACTKPSKYLYWNDNHFTEHFYKIVANDFLSKLKSVKA